MARTGDLRKLESIAAAFSIPGCPRGITPYGNGHINDTYMLTCDGPDGPMRFVLQGLNDRVFPRPEQLMGNLLRVTTHLRTKLQSDTESPGETRKHVLTLVPALDGRPFHVDDDGRYWRVFLFIDGARTYDTVKTRNQAFQAGSAFGAFQKLLEDLPAPRLHEAIPGFHDTEARLRMLYETLRHDPCGRVTHTRSEIRSVDGHTPMVGAFQRLQDEGVLRERVVHNDTKINNVMIDDRTACWICVIDLDTVGPGLTLHDFGDLIRTAATDAQEDEPDLAKVSIRLPLFRSLVRGYLGETKGFLQPGEISRLVTAGKILILESAVRFLTDYLDGDRYFRTHRRDHNLDRCRVQLKLLQDICQYEDRMQEVVEQEWGDVIS